MADNIVDQDYADCIYYIETIFNNTECNYFICTGDFNTYFSRLNAHTSSLNDFIERNSLAVTWDHPTSIKDNTYCNLSLNHFLCIDHFVVTHNILTVYLIMGSCVRLYIHPIIMSCIHSLILILV